MDHDSVKCCGFELEPDITGGLSLKGGELDGGIRLPEGDYIVQQVYKKMSVHLHCVMASFYRGIPITSMQIL